MNRKTVLLLIALALVVVVVWQQLVPKDTDAGIAGTTSVVVAKSDIPPYTILSYTDLMTTEVSLDDALNCFYEESDVVGMMSTTELRAGNKVSRANVLDVKSNWPDDSTDDMLIGSFRVDTAHIIGGQLRPGHHIDLLATRAETNSQEAESLWLARDIWVVGVYQSGGDDVVRPTVELYQEGVAPTAAPAAGGGALGGFAGTGSSLREGPANLVVVAVPRETARMISDYLGARLYSAWVYVRPGGTPITSGRIDGLVFHDVEPDLMQQRNESGLDDVKIVLKTVKGVEVDSRRTASGGKFTFDDVAAGVYYVEEQDPAGFESLSANKLRVEVSAGQNLHIQFADVAEGATPMPTAEPTAVNLPCDVSAHIAATQGGGPANQFAYDTSDVWVVVDWKECDADMPFNLTAYYVPEEGNLQEVASGRWGTGTGSNSFQIRAWDGGVFKPGSYNAQVRIGGENALAAIVSWTVGAAPTPVPTAVVVVPANPTPTPPVPTTGDRPEAPEAVTQFGYGHGR